MGNEILVERPAFGTTVACRACGAVATGLFFEQRNVPTNSCILLATADEARAYSRGDIELVFCNECGFVFNQAFDPKLTEYSGRYEETQSFSETFNSFHYQLADRLIEQHGLGDKRVLEIGCGKGEFLKLVCERAGARGIGFDPGYQDGRLDLDGLDITFIKDFYGKKYVDEVADFVCCKMTLEHIPEAQQFMQIVRATIADDEADVFFQIPEAQRIFERLAFEDVYYEHCNYFTADSASRLFAGSGFAVNAVDVEYDDQYLTVEADTGAGAASAVVPDADALAKLRDLVRTYAGRVADEVSAWRSMIDETIAGAGTVVLWGSGSKGVSFLSAVDRDDTISAVVDINPNRSNHYMCGTGHPIVSPDSLVDDGVDLVIVMNRIYVPEIRDQLAGLGLTPRVEALGALTPA